MMQLKNFNNMAVTRSTVNKEQYAAPEFEKSGFSLSYKKYGSYLLGRIQASGFQMVMPGDKISGKNDGNFTFNRITTPMVAPVDVAQYNMYIPFRALDRTFERALAPSKNNGMSASWSAPTVSTRYIVNQIMRAYLGYSPTDTTLTLLDEFCAIIGDDGKSCDLAVTTNTSYSSFDSWFYGSNHFYEKVLKSLTDSTGKLYLMAKALYLDDALLDIRALLESRFGSATSSAWSGSDLINDFTQVFLDALLTPFVGRYSYYADFGYKYLRPNDYYRIANGRISGFYDFDTFLALFDDTPQVEYPLRAMYVMWYEHFRNVDLEPENSNLPYWRDFGSTSIFDLANGGNLCFLLYRIRSWADDMFVSAQIDDLSRHVYAPVYAYSTGRVKGHDNPENNLDAGQPDKPAFAFAGSAKPSLYTLAWYDQLTDQQVSVDCPVPANVNDVLAAADLAASDVYGLDLNSLRQSQMLERYLKRNYLFGDEYQDRMLAHYNSRVSDLRINRPEILSRSLNASNMEQEIANMSNGISNAGDRTAIGTLASSGDQFTTYCEEFGIIVNLITFMPQAAYDGITPQLLSTKVNDYPLPEFAANNEEFGRKMEIADSGLVHGSSAGDDNRYMFGRYPAYHAWRSRVDAVGGMFLNELQDCTFRRFWGLYSDDTTPKLNYYFIHCRPNLQMFANTVMYDSQIYGDVVHECFVERVLPTPVEVI